MSPVQKARVLIVDDYPTNIKVLSDLLIEYGFEVLIARNGENALQKLQRITPDIILLDILMPGIDGFETCRRLKAQRSTQDIPVIFMTALSDPIDKIKGLTMGAVDYITKPFQQEEVLARVNTHLKIRQLTKSLEEHNAQLQQEVRSRLLAESALRRSEEKFATAFRSNPGPMMILTLEEGRFLNVNQTFCQVLGYPPEAVLGKTLKELDLLCKVEDCDRLLTPLRSRGSDPQHDYQVYTQSGDIKTLMIAVEIMPVQDQPCVLAMAWDVTECRQITAELKQAKAAAEQANRAKSQFLAYISHELRTPLSNILGYAQLMDRHATWDQEQQSYLDVINHSSEHLLQLINNILTMAKIEAEEITLHETDVALPDLLTTLVEMLQPEALEKNLTFTCQLAQDLPDWIHTDATKLRQVLINLVSNALKFTETGNVTLIAHLQTNPSQPEHLIFKVEDTGPGIPAHSLDTIFEPFRQTALNHEPSEGTGLGLSISRRFARLLGGDLTVNSILGQGSIFTFQLPVKSPLSSRESFPLTPKELPARVIGLAPEQPQYRILVAEDQAAYRQLLVNLLTSVGFEVKTATNGEEAVAIAQAWLPHLIWMDICMPIKDGTEATRQIRSLWAFQSTDPSPYLQSAVQTQARPPIIIALTANVFEMDKSPDRAPDYDDILLKPIPEEILFAKLNQHLGVRYRYASFTPDLSLPPSFQTTAPAAFVISQATWNSLRNMVGGNDAFLTSYITDSLAELPKLMQALQKAWETSDPMALSLTAHSIKGMGLTFGATHLVNLCQNLETQANLSTPIGKAQIKAIELELAKVLAALRMELPDGQPEDSTSMMQ